jgi:hypothetical protein
VFSKYELTIVEKGLKYMKNNKKGKKCIEMNIKCISPFHILILTSWFNEILIAYKPETQSMLMKSAELYLPIRLRSPNDNWQTTN